MTQQQYEAEVLAEEYENATSFYKEVARIQNELHAPKGQFNKFGGYKYRSCEDILEGLKKVKGGLVVTVQDDVVVVGDRFYIKATATITDGVNKLTNTAFARESLSKKGMDDSQVTGAASSYARKYALNGLFCIDDTQDADTQDNAQAYDLSSKEQLKTIEDLITKTGSDKAAILSYYKVKNLKELRADNANHLITQLKKKTGE